VLLLTFTFTRYYSVINIHKLYKEVQLLSRVGDGEIESLRYGHIADQCLISCLNTEKYLTHVRSDT